MENKTETQTPTVRRGQIRHIEDQGTVIRVDITRIDDTQKFETDKILFSHRMFKRMVDDMMEKRPAPWSLGGSFVYYTDERIFFDNPEEAPR